MSTVSAASELSPHLRVYEPARLLSSDRVEIDYNRSSPWAPTMTASKSFAVLTQQAAEAFAVEVAAQPPMSLRAANARDSYEAAPSFCAVRDRISDTYLEEHYWGIPHLDPVSFRHYLPALLDFGLRHLAVQSIVVDTLLSSLRPPDREPPRLAALSADQEQVIVEMLDYLAFDEHSVYQADGQLALEEWWGPAARYRTPQA